MSQTDNIPGILHILGLLSHLIRSLLLESIFDHSLRLLTIFELVVVMDLLHHIHACLYSVNSHLVVMFTLLLLLEQPL